MASAASGRLVLMATVGALGCSCAAGPVTASRTPSHAADFASSIGALEKSQPTSPQILDARLDYAELLLAPGAHGCGPSLDLAQSQVDLVGKNPATEVMFPEGWGRAADVQYRIHLARASCSREPSVRAQELQMAVAAAQRAVQLYSGAFDYEPMAVAQFNVAAAYREAGKDADAIEALESALRMDREFGLREDAQDNYATLLEWRKQPAGPDRVAEQMNDFPNRSAAFRFLWAASDATVAISRIHARVVDGRVIHGQGARTIQRQVRAGDDGWVVSYSAPAGPFELGVWPHESEDVQGPPGAFRPMLLEFPSFEITYSGDFKAVNDLAAFSTRITRDVEAAIRERAPKGKRTSSLMSAELRSAESNFGPDVIANEVSENYSLETALWIGATLEQGVHYELVAPLSLPDIPSTVLDYHLDFTFTRELPCPNEAVKRTCVEIIVRATPFAEELKKLLANLPSGGLYYSSSIAVRIVTDPQTLQTYVHDTHSYWYVTVGGDTPHITALESERSLLNSTYR